jgi:hypothetical protein
MLEWEDDMAAKDENRTTIRVADAHGNTDIIVVTDEVLAANPELAAIIDRVRGSGATVADYGNSYERSGGHDKTFDKEPGHDRSQSRSS